MLKATMEMDTKFRVYAAGLAPTLGGPFNTLAAAERYAKRNRMKVYLISEERTALSVA